MARLLKPDFFERDGDRDKALLPCFVERIVSETECCRRPYADIDAVLIHELNSQLTHPWCLARVRTQYERKRHGWVIRRKLSYQERIPAAAMHI